MQGAPEILFWRRTDVTGLERLKLSISADAVVAESTVICVEDGGFRLDHKWRLTPDWRAQSLDVERWGPTGRTHLNLERTDGGWRVNGSRRSDLDGADEPDLSITPFCNTFPIRRTPAERSMIEAWCFATSTSSSGWRPADESTRRRSRERNRSQHLSR
jgi:uncharacterized protein